MKRISIIVPVYNTEKYLDKCLESLVNQTIDDIEIIIINDGSTDNSSKIIEKFVNLYPEKIKAFTKINGGLSDTRNYGIKKAVGEFIAFVDSDDYVDKNMYETMYEIAKKENADFVECDFSWAFTNHEKKDIGKIYKIFDDYFVYGRVMMCNKIFKKKIITENNILFPNNLNYEDIEFFYKFILHTKKSNKVNRIFYYYNQRENSIINIQTAKNTDIITILQNVVNYYKQLNVYDKYKSELEYLYIRLLLGSSFLRIIKIKDKKIKKELLEKNFNELNTKFPKWKNNNLLKKYKTKKNLYYKTINNFTYKVYALILK